MTTEILVDKVEPEEILEIITDKSNNILKVEEIISTNVDRSTQQDLAKDELIKILSSILGENKTLQIINLLRNNQYLFTLGLIEVTIHGGDELIYVLEAIMNGGKSHIITNFFPILFALNRYFNLGFDSLLITSYKKEVVNQFKSDILNISTLRQLDKVFYTNGDKKLIITVEDDNELNLLGMSREERKELKNINIITMDAYSILADTYDTMGIEYNLLSMVNLHVTSRDLAPIKYNRLINVFSGRHALTLIDELQSGLALNPDGKFPYLEVLGHNNNEFNGTLYISLKALPFIKKRIGITGTITVAHRDDFESFRVVHDLIVKSEIKEYTKEVSVKYFDTPSERINYLFKAHYEEENKYKNRKIVSVIWLPVNGAEGYSTEYWEKFILGVCSKFGYDETNIISHYMRDNMPMRPPKDVVSLLEDYDSPVKFLLVKNAFSAGINIRNVRFFTSIRESIAPKKLEKSLFYSIHQFFMRFPRFYTNVENAAKSWKDITTPMGRDLNSVEFILPPIYKAPMDEFLLNYVTEKKD